MKVSVIWTFFCDHKNSWKTNDFLIERLEINLYFIKDEKLKFWLQEHLEGE